MTTARRQRDNPTGDLPDIPNRRMRTKQRSFVAALALVLGLGGGLTGAGEAAVRSVSIDTTVLAGTAAQLDFVLLDGDFAPDNSVIISNLATDGVFGATNCTLGCAGGPPYTIDDSLAFGQFLQDLTLGTVVSFDLAFSTNYSGINAPDRFTLNLLDPGSGFTLVDTDLDFLSDPVPAQDALLVIDLQGAGLVRVPTITNPPILITVVPEPGTLVLCALGLLVLATRRAHAVRRRTVFR